MRMRTLGGEPKQMRDERGQYATQSCIKFTVGANCLREAGKVIAGSLLAPIFCTVRGSVNGAFQQDLLRPSRAPVLHGAVTGRPRGGEGQRASCSTGPPRSSHLYGECRFYVKVGTS